jgi:hypothetical protein
MAKPRTSKKTNGIAANPAAANQAEVSPAEVTPIDAVSAAHAAEKSSVETKPRAKKPVSKPEAAETPALSKTGNGNGSTYANQVPAKLVPINVEDEIRQLAYSFSERRGFAPGHENDDWLAAEREVFQRYHHHSA